MRTDGQLVAAVLAGQREAYRQLVVRHERSVRALAWAVLHDDHAAEDVAQEAFVTAYEKLRSLRRPDAFAAWVAQIARREAIRLARQHQRGPGRLPDEPVPARPGDAADDGHALMQAIASLPRRQRTLVMLTYFEQRTAAQIARIQGCPVGTVTRLLSRARRRLRQRLEEQQR